MSSTRFSRSSSDSCIADLVVAVAEALRARGVRVPTSAVIESVEVLESYVAVRGLDPCSPDPRELFYVLSSTLVKDDEGVEALRRVVEGLTGHGRDAFEAVRHDMAAVGSRFGGGVAPPWRLGEGGRAAYARLRLLGLMVRGKRGWRILGRRAARGRVERLVRRYGSLESALEEAVVRDVERGGGVSALLGREFPEAVFDRVSIDGLAGLVESALKVGEYGLARRAAARLRERVARGERGFDADRVYRVLRRMGLVDGVVAARLVDEEPRLVERMGLSVEGLESLLSRARNPRAIGRIVSELERRGVSVGGVPLDVAGTGRLARALVYALRGLETGNRGYVDMAYLELEKAGGGGLVGLLVGAVDCFLSKGSCVEELVDVLTRMHVRGMLSLEGLVSAVGGVSRDPRLRGVARRLMRMVLHRLLYRYYGCRGVQGYYYSASRAPGARLDVRRSVRSLVSMRGCPVYRVPRRRRSVVLLLDKSGSMREYSLVALLAAYAFSGSLRRLVVFDQDVRVFDGEAVAGRVFAELFSLGVRFEGYTDVVSALAEASRGLPASRLVLVSDLRQTVVSEEGVAEALRKLHGRGWRLFIVAPPSVDENVLRAVRGFARVLVAGSVEELAKGLKRLLA